MSRPRVNDWKGKIDLTSNQMEELYEAWSDDLEDARESLETTTQELEDARTEAAAPPEWGGCRRGCPPSYLNPEGYCSPACVLGAPRGEYVTPVNNLREWEITHGG